MLFFGIIFSCNPKLGRAEDSDSDKIYPTKIDTGTISGLHKFHKHTSNNLILIHSKSYHRHVGRPLSRSYPTAGMEVTRKGRAFTVMTECIMWICVNWITDDMWTRVRDQALYTYVYVYYKKGMDENAVINCHWCSHCFRNENDSHRDHPLLPTATLISIRTPKWNHVA